MVFSSLRRNSFLDPASKQKNSFFILLITYIDTSGLNGSYGPLAKSWIWAAYQAYTKKKQIRLVDTMKYAIIKFAAKIGNPKQNQVYVK